MNYIKSRIRTDPQKICSKSQHLQITVLVRNLMRIEHRMVHRCNRFVTVCVTLLFKADTVLDRAVDVYESGANRRSCDRRYCSSKPATHKHKAWTVIYTRHNEDSTNKTEDTRVSCIREQGSFPCLIYDFSVPREKCQALTCVSLSRLCFSWNTVTVSCCFGSCAWILARSECSMLQPRFRSDKYTEQLLCGLICSLFPVYKTLRLTAQSFSSSLTEASVLCHTPRVAEGSCLPVQGSADNSRQEQPLFQTRGLPASSSTLPCNGRPAVFKSAFQSSHRPKFHCHYRSSYSKVWSNSENPRNIFWHQTGHEKQRRQLLWILTLVFTFSHLPIIGLPSAHAQGLIGKFFVLMYNVASTWHCYIGSSYYLHRHHHYYYHHHHHLL